MVKFTVYFRIGEHDRTSSSYKAENFTQAIRIHLERYPRDLITHVVNDKTGRIVEIDRV